MKIKGVKPKWRGYKESWIGLTILMLIHIYQDMESNEDEPSHGSVIDNIGNMTWTWMIFSWDFKWMLNVGSRYDVTWGWLDRVKITRKELRGTKQRWRASDGLATEVPWLRWRIEYLHWVEVLIELWGVILCGESNNYWIISGSDLKPWMELPCVEMVQVTSSRLICSKDWDKDGCNPYEEILRRYVIWGH
jgi:hypothetical protein